MDKLVMLSEIRSKKVKDKFPEINETNVIEEDINKSYITFKEKFDNYENQDEIIDLNGNISFAKHQEKLNETIERIFLLENKVPLLDFINSIYEDDLGANTKVNCIKNCQSVDERNQIKSLRNTFNIKILAEDDYRKFEYQIQFLTKDEQNIGLTIFKNDLSINSNKIVNINKKRRQHENDIEDNKSEILKKVSNPWLIMLNSNIEVPDVYEYKSSDGSVDLNYEINILKSWKYDLKHLLKSNMYLLIPMKAFDLRKRISYINEDVLTKDLIKDEVLRFFKDMNVYLRRVKENGLITDQDVNEFNLIAIDLLNDYIKEKKNICIDMKKDIEEKLKDIVV